MSTYIYSSIKNQRSLLRGLLKKGSCVFVLCILSLLANGQQIGIVSNDDNKITLKNGALSFTFEKSSALLSGIEYAHQSNILGPKGGAYLVGPGFSISPSTFKIVRQEPDEIEISFSHKADNHFDYELHYVLKSNVSGIYCFLIQRHDAKDPAGNYGQTRWGIRADEKNFDYHLVRDSIQGPMPTMELLKKSKKIQDWTYLLPDSTVYTKYDYADYIENRHVHGMAGQKSGLGLFVIQASHEYLNGGPTKQYQNVHSTPFLICMFNCGHFLSDIRKADNIITGNWSKLDGPFLLYVNQGKDIPAIWQDAKAQMQKEINQWPYQWMNNTDYPLQRGRLTGKILLDSQHPAAFTHIILAAPGYDWQAQSDGYIYSTVSNIDGHFDLQHIRTGDYCLYAYGANRMTSFIYPTIHIEAGKTLSLPKLIWKDTSEGKTIWQIGIADRMTTGFKLSDHKRQYGLFNLPPDNLTYTIDKSDWAKDWYYAQTKNGDWNINFELQHSIGNNMRPYLNLAFAGVAKKPTLEIYVNGHPGGKLNDLGNDASIYRSAVRGGYYQYRKLAIDPTLLHKGKNTITLRLENNKSGGGIMYDAIKLSVSQNKDSY